MSEGNSGTLRAAASLAHKLERGGRIAELTTGTIPRGTMARKQRAASRAAAPGKTSKKAIQTETRLTKEQRVQLIVEMMVGCSYVDGVTPVKLAAEWGYSASAVQRDAAEASRLVRLAAGDPDWASRIRLMLAHTISKAMEGAQYRTVIEGIKALQGITLDTNEPGAETPMQAHAQKVLSELERRVKAFAAGRDGSGRPLTAGGADTGGAGADGLGVDGAAGPAASE